MSHVMSLINFPTSIGSMSHVDFKKWPCRRVEFKGQEPSTSQHGFNTASLAVWLISNYYNGESREPCCVN